MILVCKFYQVHKPFFCCPNWDIVEAMSLVSSLYTSIFSQLYLMFSAGEKKLGTPGTPGGQDLAAALQRLHAQQESRSLDLFEERKHKLQQGGEVSSGFLTPNDSILSTGTNYSGMSEVSGSSSLSLGSRSYLPEKLQIVKPLEGKYMALSL